MTVTGDRHSTQVPRETAFQAYQENSQCFRVSCLNAQGLPADEEKETWVHSTVALVSHIWCPVPTFPLRGLVPSMTLPWVVRMTELRQAAYTQGKRRGVLACITVDAH